MSDTSYLDKTASEIKDEVRNLSKQKLGITHLRPVGVLTGIVETLATVIAWLYTTFLQPLKKQTNLNQATGTFLDHWGTFLAVSRKQASKAEGTIQAQAYHSGTIPKDTKLTITGTTLVYLVIQDTQFSTGTFTVPIIAEKTGIEYSSIDTNSISANFNPVISGIELITFPPDWYTSPGSDTETDSSYRTRIKAQWLKTAAGDVPLLYTAEAQAIDGVTEAKVFRTPNNKYGSTRIVIRGANNTAPNTTLVQQVYTHLSTVGLIARQLLVEAVKLKALAVTCNFRGTLTEEEAKNRIYTYIQSLKIGEPYTIQALYNLFDDQDDVQFSAPIVSDITLAVDTIYTATITVSKDKKQ